MKKCEATIVFGDDFGDNDTPMHCQLEDGHKGQHQEVGDMGYGEGPIPYSLTWIGDSNA